MYIHGQSKHKFGDLKAPFINIHLIASIEQGHEGNLNVKMANAEELVVTGEDARKLLAYVEKNMLRPA
jgi:hypothetical protein